MRIYTEVNFEWDDKQGKLVETSSESFDYQGELALCFPAKAPDWFTFYDIAGNKWQLKGIYSTWSDLIGEVSRIEYYKNGVEIDSTSSPPGDNAFSVQQTTFKDWAKGTTDKGGYNFVGTETYDSRAAANHAFESEYGFQPAEDPNKNEEYTGTNIAHIEGYETDNSGTGVKDDAGNWIIPDWSNPESGVALATDSLVDDPIKEDIRVLLDEFDEIVDPDLDDPYTDELKAALGDIETSRETAEEAMTTFNEDLATEWELYKESATDWEDKYRSGDEFTDENNNKVWDEGEPFVDTDDDGKYTPPGTELQDVIDTYTDAEIPLAEARTQALRDIGTDYGDFFIDAEGGVANVRDEGEEWGDVWTDANNDQKIDAGELSLSEEASGRDYKAGSKIEGVETTYREIETELFGTKGLTEDDEDYVEGTYYRDLRLEEEERTEGFKGIALTRGEQFADLRGERRDKITEANASGAGRGFASSGVGYTAREQLAREIGEQATDIQEEADIGRTQVEKGYTEDVKDIEERTTTAFGKATTDYETDMKTYYGDLKDKAEDAEVAYTTSEGILAKARDKDLTEKAEMLMDPLKGVPYQQFSFEETAEDLMGGWKEGAIGMREALTSAGAISGTWAEKPFMDKFAIDPQSQLGTGTTRAAAEAQLETIKYGLEDLLKPLGTKMEGLESEFIEEGFDIFDSVEYGGRTIGQYYDPDLGIFSFDPEGMFDPGTEYSEFDPAAGGGWLYDPEYLTKSAPWLGDVDWSPSGG